MKNSILFIFVFITMALSPLLSQDSIPNPGFEQWSNPNMATAWQTTNTLLPPGLNNCFQTTNSHSGAFALQMNTIDMNGILIPAAATLGTVGVGFTEGGIPFSGKPIALHLFIRHPSTGDEVFVAAQFFNSGVSIGGGSWSGIDSIAVFTEIVIPISFAGNLVPDTMNITMLTDSWTEGSMMQVDDLAFEYLPTSNQETSANQSMQFYPNPCQNRLYYQTSENSPFVADVFKSNGQLIKHNLIVEPGNAIDVNELPLGLYILQYHMNGRLFRYKFIKQ